MELNSDFSARVVVHSADQDWVPSPAAGVERRMLDRIGGEVARATTIVRFAPDAEFSAHTHHGGEEYIVLEGVFQDEDGDFPAGTYVRNPPTSAHTPGSRGGCTIFVKLWQFAPDDRTQFSKPMADQLGEPVEGVATAILHQDHRETVTYHHVDAGASFASGDLGGIEVLVIEGELTESGDTLRKGSWIRLPDGHSLDATAGSSGARIWMKTGHLLHAQAPNAAG